MNVKKDNYYLGNVFNVIDGDNYIEYNYEDFSDDEIDELERLMAVK